MGKGQRDRGRRRNRVGVGPRRWLVAMQAALWCWLTYGAWHKIATQPIGVAAKGLYGILACAVTLYTVYLCLTVVTRLRHRVEVDEHGVSKRTGLSVTTVPWSRIAGLTTERDEEGAPTWCVLRDDDSEEVLSFDLTDPPRAERERFLAFVEAHIAARGHTELLSAGAPEGSGLEPEAAPAPAGRGTEPEAVAPPAPDKARAGRR